METDLPFSELERLHHDRLKNIRLARERRAYRCRCDDCFTHHILSLILQGYHTKPQLHRKAGVLYYRIQYILLKLDSVGFVHKRPDAERKGKTLYHPTSKGIEYYKLVSQAKWLLHQQDQEESESEFEFEHAVSMKDTSDNDRGQYK